MEQKKNNIFRPTTSKSSMFLLELVLVILFFSIASTVCIEMFVKSYTISNNSTHINKSVQIAENLAETFKSQTSLISYSYTDTYYFSSDAEEVDEENCTYIAIVNYSSSNNTNTADINVYVDDVIYFTLQVDQYISERSQK